MKIIIVNTFFSPFGGAEIIAYNQYKILKENGYDVYFWATDRKPYFEQDYAFQKYFTKFNGGTFNYIKNPYKYFNNYIAKNDLQNFINFIKPDLIHFHNIFTLSPSILDCCKNIPSIMTLHDSALVCPAGTMLLRNKVICSNLLCKNKNYLPCIKNKCRKNSLEASIRLSLLNYLNVKKLHNINKFITPSNALKNLILEANIGIKEDRITTINNFIPLNEVLKSPNYGNNGYFLYIGRLSKEKGVHYLLQAIKNLPKKIEVHIVGKGNEEENLKQYAKENNLYNVKFLGFKNRKEIKEEYQNCIATILPCNWFENFPTTNMESFINAKPVIASNIGGIPEQVEHNKTGLLFEPANVEQLKECILTYWNNSELVTQHGKNAYQKAQTQYTEEKYYQKLIKIYREFVKYE